MATVKKGKRKKVIKRVSPIDSLRSQIANLAVDHETDAMDDPHA